MTSPQGYVKKNMRRHLSVLTPLVAQQDGTSAVLKSLVRQSCTIHVVPEKRRTSLGTNTRAYPGEDGPPAYKEGKKWCIHIGWLSKSK